MYSLIFLAKLGRQIKYYRTTKGVSQEELANTLGMRRSYFGSIERGEKNMTIATILSVCDGLGISPAELFSAAEKGE